VTPPPLIKEPPEESPVRPPRDGASDDPFATGDDELARFAEHQGPVLGLDVSHDGKYIVTASHDAASYVLDGQTLEKVSRFEHNEPLTGAAMFPDRTVLLAGMFDKRANGSLFHWTSWPKSPEMNVLADSEQDSLSLAVARHDGRAVVTMNGGHVRIYFAFAIPRERVGLEKPRDGEPFRAVAVAPEGSALLLASGGDVLRFEMGGERREFVGRLEGETTSIIRDLCFLPGSEFFVSGHDDGVARLCNAATGEVVKRYAGEHGAVSAVAVDEASQRVLTGDSQGEIRCWERATGRLLHMYRGHREAVMQVVFLPDGQTFASASLDATVRLWASPPESLP
jgi:WD40 repeat protein